MAAILSRPQCVKMSFERISYSAQPYWLFAPPDFQKPCYWVRQKWMSEYYSVAWIDWQLNCFSYSQWNMAKACGKKFTFQWQDSRLYSHTLKYAKISARGYDLMYLCTNKVGIVSCVNPKQIEFTEVTGYFLHGGQICTLLLWWPNSFLIDSIIWFEVNSLHEYSEVLIPAQTHNVWFWGDKQLLC